MRKTLLIFSLIILFMLSGSSASVIAFAEIAPIYPEGKLFQLQDNLEHAMLVFYTNSTSKSWYEMKILDKRVKDLENIAGNPEEIQRMNAVWVELDHVLRQLQDGNSDNVNNLRLHFVKTLSRIKESMNQFTYLAKNFPTEFSLAQEKLNLLKTLAIDDSNPLSELYVLNHMPLKTSVKVSSITNIVPGEQDAMEPHKIPFLPGSAGANHEFFPLMGKHAELTCEGCHSGITYEGLPDQCVECHLTVLPIDHYQGVCSLCHTAIGWIPASFDHTTAAAADCQSCHLMKKPANHFSGQCSACHSTNAWIPASFDHAVAGATDCQSCHSGNKPANHFSGQCSACHSTNAWRPASFNHAAMGANDCQSCHSGNKPANHFAGQCSSCHNTDSWQGASFNHSFPVNHGKANGECAQCHPAGGSSWTCFNCHSQSKMNEKHEEKGIPDYVARCMECHGDGEKDDD